MTFLVAFVTRKFIVLAGDTLVSRSTGPGASREMAQDSKIFSIGRRFGVMSHGEGPGEHVPIAIKRLRVESGAGTRDIAEKLMARFRQPPLPQMGLYVAGWDNGRPTLLHVNVATGSIEWKNKPSDEKEEKVGIFFNQFKVDKTRVFGPSGRPPHPLTEARAIEFARRMVEIVGSEHPETVGGVPEVLVVRPDGVRWASRLARPRR